MKYSDWSSKNSFYHKCFNYNIFEGAYMCQKKKVKNVWFVFVWPKNHISHNLSVFVDFITISLLVHKTEYMLNTRQIMYLWPYSTCFIFYFFSCFIFFFFFRIEIKIYSFINRLTLPFIFLLFNLDATDCLKLYNSRCSI